MSGDHSRSIPAITDRIEAALSALSFVVWHEHGAGETKLTVGHKVLSDNDGPRFVWVRQISYIPWVVATATEWDFAQAFVDGTTKTFWEFVKNRPARRAALLAAGMEEKT